MALGLISSSPLRAAPSTHSVLGAGYAVLVASVGIGSWFGWQNATTSGLVELGTAVLWLAAFPHWSRAGDAETTRFWPLTGWAALGVAGYCVAAGIADLTGIRWPGVAASVFALASVPLLLAGMGSRSNRQEGARAGATTVLDVAIIVLSVAGLLGPADTSASTARPAPRSPEPGWAW